MDRFEKYYIGEADEVLKTLESQGIDVKEYITGLNSPDFEVVLNKNNYKIFQIEELRTLKYKIREFEKEILRREIVDKNRADGTDLEKVVGGHRQINAYIDGQVEKIYNNVIQKYKVEEDEEEYYEVAARTGVKKARLWYWLHVINSIPTFIKDSFIRNKAMFKNYLKIAVRNLMKQKTYSVINVFGLSIGMACVILIYLFVKDEIKKVLFDSCSLSNCFIRRFEICNKTTKSLHLNLLRVISIF